MGFNCLKATATSRRQFTFYHSVPRNSWYSFYRPRKNERLSRSWSHKSLLSFDFSPPHLYVNLKKQTETWKNSKKSHGCTYLKKEKVDFFLAILNKVTNYSELWKSRMFMLQRLKHIVKELWIIRWQKSKYSRVYFLYIVSCFFAW